MLKVVTIGGGSSYTPELVEGFIKRYDRFPITELWFVDVEEGRDKVETVAALAVRMFKKANLDVKVVVSFDQREAVVDADFVTTQFRVGQLHARYLDESIPAKYEELGQETNGAGGFFKGMRTIPVIEKLIKDVQELAPKAWIINFTNPAGMVSEYVNRFTDFKKFIGVCNVPIHMRNDLADAIDVDREDLLINFLGLNHFVFGLSSSVNGVDTTEKTLDAFINSSITMQNIEHIPWDKDFLYGLKLIPCPYHQYYFQFKEKIKHQNKDFAEGNIRSLQVIETEKILFEKYKDPNLEEKPKELESRGGAYYSDVACDVLASIYGDEGKIHTVDIKNNGHVTNIHSDDTIEITCRITKDGPIPLDTITLMPEKVLGLYQLLKTFEIESCKAINHRDLKECLTALNLSPFVSSDSDVKKLFDELVEAHAKFLTEYK